KAESEPAPPPALPAMAQPFASQYRFRPKPVNFINLRLCSISNSNWVPPPPIVQLAGSDRPFLLKAQFFSPIRRNPLRLSQRIPNGRRIIKSDHQCPSRRTEIVDDGAS